MNVLSTEIAPTSLGRGAQWRDARWLERRYQQALTSLLVLLTLMMGWWKLDRDGSSWRDETVSYAVGKRSLGELWHLVHNIDAVHGLYYFVAHLVLAGWDDGVVSLRAVSVAGALAAVLGVDAIGRILAGPQVGFLSGLAFVCVPQVQFYAQEARSYAWVAAMAVWATWFFLRALREARRMWWVGYAATLTLAGWLHVFALLVLLAHGMTLWCGRLFAAHGWRWFVSVTAAGLLVSPLAVISAGQARAQLDWLGRPGLGEWLAWGVPAGMGAALALSLRRRGPAAVSGAGAGPVSVQVIALPLLVAPAGFLLAVSLLRPWYVDRYVLYGWAGLALLIGSAARQGQLALRAVADPGRRRLVVRCAVACALVGASALGVSSWQQRLPTSRTDAMEGFWGLTADPPGERRPIVFQPARRRAWVLARPAYNGPLDDVALRRSPEASGTLYGVEEPPDVVRRRMLRHPELTVLRDRPGQPQDQAPAEVAKRAVLHKYFQLCWATPLHGGEWTLYIRRDYAVTDPLCAPGRDVYS